VGGFWREDEREHLGGISGGIRRLAFMRARERDQPALMTEDRTAVSDCIEMELFT